MRYFVLILLFLSSCTKQETITIDIVLEKGKINAKFLNSINAPEKALLSWYLFAYGNECGDESSKVKCQILKEMNIKDECESSHLNNLLQWFSLDMLAVYKLNNCSKIPLDSAIQNAFKNIILIRKGESLSIKYSVMGLNTIQEKSWNISQTDSYLIRNNTLIKISNNE